jgi:hypothetical protein
MASEIGCKCGHTLHKNLFAGGDVALLTPEAFLEQNFTGVSAEKMALMLILASRLMLTCPQCGRVALVEESGDGDTVQFLKADNDA